MARGRVNVGGKTKINAIIADYEIEAGQNINAGDLVSFINEKARPADDEIVYVSNQQFDIYVNTMFAIELDSSRVLITYQNNTTFCQAVVATISGESISLGTPVTWFFSSLTIPHASIKVDTDRVLVVYKNSTSDFKGIMFTVTGTTITTHVNYTISATNCNYPVLTLLETNKVLMTFTNNSTHVAALVITISGNVITGGTIYVVKSEVSNLYSTQPGTARLDSGRVLIVYPLAGSIEVVVLSISGTVISVGTPLVVATAVSATYNFADVTLMGVNKAAILYNHVIASNNNAIKAAILTVSGTTISKGTDRIVYRGSAYFTKTQIVKFSENKAIGNIQVSNAPTILSFLLDFTLSTPYSTKARIAYTEQTSSDKYYVKSDGVILSLNVQSPIATARSFISILRLMKIAQGLATQNGVGGETKKFYDWR